MKSLVYHRYLRKSNHGINKSMPLNNIHVFTDIDLDGAASLLVLHHALKAKPGELSVSISTVTKLRQTVTLWLQDHKFEDYKTVFFMDHDTSELADLMDLPNVVVIDHHLSHVQALGVYKQAQLFVQETTSCAKLAYHIFKPKLTHLTDAQKYLVGLADDYDCFKFALPETYDLNCLFTNTQRAGQQTRTDRFIERFYNGFDGFNIQESNIIKNYKRLRDLEIESCKIYAGDIPIGGAKHRVVATFGSKFTNDVCEYLIKQGGAEIAIFYNMNSNHVSFRKASICPVDLSKLAEKLCGGGGHEYAAGGVNTPELQAFVNLLDQV